MQHRLKEAGKELFTWLSNGAYLYVCGDATAMAPDVHAALLEIVATTAAWTPTTPRPGWPISLPTDGTCAMSTEVLDRPPATLLAKGRPAESPVEIIKKASRGLRGSLVESLAIR